MLCLFHLKGIAEMTTYTVGLISSLCSHRSCGFLVKENKHILGQDINSLLTTYPAV